MNQTVTAPAGLPAGNEETARRERSERYLMVAGFLIQHLFGFDEPEFITDPQRLERLKPAGRIQTVKGWYGINPETKGFEPFKYGGIPTDLGGSRRVIEAMEAKGFAYCGMKIPGKEWECSFIKDGGKVWKHRDESEALAVCEAAYFALTNPAKARDDNEPLSQIPVPRTPIRKAR